MIYEQHKKTASLFSPTQNLIYKTRISHGFIAAILFFSSSVTKPDKASFIHSNNLYNASRKALLWFYLQEKGKWPIHRGCSARIWMAVYQGAGTWRTGGDCAAQVKWGFLRKPGREGCARAAAKEPLTPHCFCYREHNREESEFPCFEFSRHFVIKIPQNLTHR